MVSHGGILHCHGGNLDCHGGNSNCHRGVSSLPIPLQTLIQKGGGLLSPLHNGGGAASVRPPLCGYPYGWVSGGWVGKEEMPPWQFKSPPWQFNLPPYHTGLGTLVKAFSESRSLSNSRLPPPAWGGWVEYLGGFVIII